MVALLLAIALPVSQLRNVVISKSCCCPDPTKCHCPDHEPGGAGDQASIKACHRSEQALVAPTLKAFVVPELALPSPALVVQRAVLPSLPSPHAAPAPRRPASPS